MTSGSGARTMLQLAGASLRRYHITFNTRNYNSTVPHITRQAFPLHDISPSYIRPAGAHRPRQKYLYNAHAVPGTALMRAQYGRS